jgi:hypothetical protein
LHACGDEARPFRSFPRPEKMMADLERRKQTEEAPFSIDDRQAAQAPFLEQMNGVVGSRVGMNADDVAFHDIAHPVGEIADENRRLDSELVETKSIRSFVFPARAAITFGVPVTCLRCA